ncbi:MAG TPA: pilus assembly protein CpaE [Galbitalea sp.]|jgi:hypothetical protein|nr:pilus assembly protein CpaE [Galbitalea sp.]
MISIALARALRDSGLVWHPTVGDAFCIDRIEADADVFYLSDLTVEAHEFSTGTVLGFNGTTEWALDSVAIEDTLWLPSEAQLRELLGSAFVRLDAAGEEFRIAAAIDGATREFLDSNASDAYARALIERLDALAS